jgi:hypothetical protein
MPIWLEYCSLVLATQEELDMRVIFQYFGSACLAVLLTIGSAHATLNNGGFETGDFSGWATIGDALVVSTSFGVTPTTGTYQALVTNGPGSLYGGQFHGSYSGISSVEANCFSNCPMDAFLGLPDGTLRALNFVPFDGSAISQVFTANAGSILSFSWNYLTDEGDFLDIDVDYAFVLLDGTLSLLANRSMANFTSGTLFANESGYHTYVSTLSNSGTHQIAIGVVDTFDPAVNSGILVDGFNVRALPEPSSLLLFGFGMVGLIIYRQYRTNNSHIGLSSS